MDNVLTATDAGQLRDFAWRCGRVAATAQGCAPVNPAQSALLLELAQQSLAVSTTATAIADLVDPPGDDDEVEGQ